MTTKTNGDELPLEARVIQCIRDFPAPKTTQDALDNACAEFQVAKLILQQAERRYDNAKRTITDAHEVDVAKVRNDAAERMEKAGKLIKGAEWVLTLSANKPAVRVEIDDVRTELIKRGFKAKVFDEIVKAVEKKSTPALIIAVNKE